MERRVRTADQLRRTDAAAALQGGIWETEDSQNTFTDGQGNKYWLIDTTGGAVSVALPAAADVSPDTIFNVKRTTGGANTLTVTPDSGNIDGSAAHSIATQYAAFGYASDGTNYHIVKDYSPLGGYVTSNSLSAAVVTDTLTVRGSGAISATASVGFINLVGGQIKFPATQNASADGNTFDDFEKGTFTPAFSSTGATFSYTAQIGVYTKSANLVCFSTRTSLNTSGNTLTANPLSITGLPFTSTSTSNYENYYNVGFHKSTTSYVAQGAVLSASSTSLTIRGITAASTTNFTIINSNAALHATDGSTIEANGCYHT